MKKIVIGSDHAGFELKKFLSKELETMGYEVLDVGTDSEETSVDYPDFAYKLCKKIIKKEFEQGILICGTGIGVSIAANRFKPILAALCHMPIEAKLARQHDNANVLCLGGRVIGKLTALECLKEFLNTEFEGGRHERRVNKLHNPEG